MDDKSVSQPTDRELDVASLMLSGFDGDEAERIVDLVYADCSDPRGCEWPAGCLNSCRVPPAKAPEMGEDDEW